MADQDSQKGTEGQEDKAAGGEPRSDEQEDTEGEKKEEPSKPSKPTKLASANLDKIIDQIEKLSVLELSQLVHALEEKFGVSASSMQAVTATTPSAASGAEEGISQQTTFNVILSDSGTNKISVIKAVRELIPTLGLKEAKDLVDSPPKPVLEGVNKETANEAKSKLETAGAKVELK